MREIKFRTWDKRYKKMDRPFNIIDALFEDRRSTIAGDPGPQDFIFMQYTGLKDKNGIEIYDGDIVKHHNSTFKVVHKELRFKLVRLAGKKPTHTFHENKDYEVLGNIYENKELLDA